MKTETTNTVAMTTTSNLFSRKIGNTTYRVSVSFSEKSNESIEDKILRLVASESISKCTVKKYGGALSPFSQSENTEEAGGLLCN